MKTSSLLLITFLLISCVQEVPIKSNYNHSKLVVLGLIKPEAVCKLQISWVDIFSDTTLPILPEIKGLEIICDETNLIEAQVSGSNAWFTTIPNKSTYKMNLITDSGLYYARTIIPNKIEISKATFWYSDLSSQNLDNLLEASIIWYDPEKEVNYYEIQLYSSERVLSYFQYDQLDDPVLQQECDLESQPSSFVFSDAQFNGQSKDLRLRFGTGYGGSPKIPWPTMVVLRSISREYYLFKKSWHKHVFLQNTSIHVDQNLSITNVYSLLFQGDPIPLYSNIENGYGIFAGYNEDMKQLTFIR